VAQRQSADRQQVLVLRFKGETRVRRGQGIAPAALAESCGGEDREASRVIRIEPGRLRRGEHRLLVSPARQQHARPSVVGERLVRRQGDRGPGLVVCIGQPFELDQGEAQQGVTDPVVRLGRKMLAVFPFGEIVPPLVVEQGSSIAPRRGRRHSFSQGRTASYKPA
jgi:hypothetical protein